METFAGPSDTSPGTRTYHQPATAQLRCLHVGDHVVVYSGGEPENNYVYTEPENASMGHGEDSTCSVYENPEDAHVYKEPENASGGYSYSPFMNYEKPEKVHVYKEPENVSTGQGKASPSSNYENPEDVHVYKEPEKVSTGQNEDSPSDDYENPEDVHVYTEPVNAGRGQNEDSPSDDNEDPEDPDSVGFVFKAKARILDMLNKAMSKKVCWLALCCGLAIMLAILASCLTPGGKILMKSGTPHWTTNSLVANDSSTSSSHHVNTSFGAKPLSTTVVPMSTTGINECAENPCQHGTCENIDTGYYCFCRPGWTGQNCQQDLNECAKSPCGHGICVNNDGGYSCTCSHGWTGQNCLQDFNECTTSPCQHGRCENYHGGYRCTCSAGWTGKNCHRALPCQSGWSEYKNNCYKLFKDKVCWSTANEKCKQHGANLASVGSAGENNFIAHLITDGG
ncbi:hypothetical protein Bbelb_084420 [Branchiostoma belcheri]|nr:hypothetical protein Bbelb_084420 [Branchiostoma belcheri]